MATCTGHVRARQPFAQRFHLRLKMRTGIGDAPRRATMFLCAAARTDWLNSRSGCVRYSSSCSFNVGARRRARDTFIRRGNRRVQFQHGAIFLQRIGPLLLRFQRLRALQLDADHAGALFLFDLAQGLRNFRSVGTNASRRFECLARLRVFRRGQCGCTLSPSRSRKHRPPVAMKCAPGLRWRERSSASSAKALRKFSAATVALPSFSSRSAVGEQRQHLIERLGALQTSRGNLIALVRSSRPARRPPSRLRNGLPAAPSRRPSIARRAPAARDCSSASSKGGDLGEFLRSLCRTRARRNPGRPRQQSVRGG